MKKYILILFGGGCPKTSACNSEILQSEGLAAVSCPISRIIAPFLGHSNSHISNDTYKLKVEKLKTDVFGRPVGGQCYFGLTQQLQCHTICIVVLIIIIN